MAFIRIADVLANEYNFTPLPRTWYELQVNTIDTKTYRFAKRTDHTGVLIKLDMAEFYLAQPLPPR